MAWPSVPAFAFTFANHSCLWWIRSRLCLCRKFMPLQAVLVFFALAGFIAFGSGVFLASSPPAAWAKALWPHKSL